GIRDFHVTGVQTCALRSPGGGAHRRHRPPGHRRGAAGGAPVSAGTTAEAARVQTSGDRVTDPPGGARAWLVWAVGVGVYFLAMFHRNGMGVAALEAQERFQVGPAVLSLLPMLQLLVYVVLQVPAGLMADRVGPRRSLLLGLASMALGVVLFAFAPNIALAVAGRVLIGLGDAVTFLNVIRLGALWFPRRRYALVRALTEIGRASRRARRPTP